MPKNIRHFFIFSLDESKTFNNIANFIFNNMTEMAIEKITQTLTVENKMGIHARPAAMIVRISNKYPNTDIYVEKDGEQVNGKSIMSLMMLAAGKGSEIKFVAEGEDAQIMLAEITDLFNRKFDEE